MSQDFFVTIDEVVNLLGLERDPRNTPGADSYNVRCPFCGDTKYKMNINTRKNAYHCVRCSSDDQNTGVLDLYGRVRLGERMIPGPSGNAKELSRKLREEISGETRSEERHTACCSQEFVEILPEGDIGLNAAYSALLSLDYLKLTEKHRKNLLERGLEDDVILKNGYASMPDPETWCKSHEKYPVAEKLYRDAGLDLDKVNYPRLARVQDDTVIAGMLIANDLRKQGIHLDGIPGFYKLKDVWIFNISCGMLIPTRNCVGEVVGLQVRRDFVDNGGPRYMTVSSKGLKNGVNVNISRTHFPLSNEPLDCTGKNNPKVIVTEGPLKADVAAYLYKPPAYFIAVQGVNNIREMPGLAGYLRLFGIEHVYNAFDMDRIINPYVGRACERLREIFAEAGVRTIPLIWDYMDYIHGYEQELRQFCEDKGCMWSEFSDALVSTSRNINALAEMGTDFREFTDAHPWKGAKGIDDYLLAQKKAGRIR